MRLCVKHVSVFATIGSMVLYDEKLFRMLGSLGLWAFQGKGHHASQWDIPGKEDGEEVFGLPR